MKKAPVVYNVRDVLFITLKVIRETGEFVSAKKAEASAGQKTPTSAFVLQQMKSQNMAHIKTMAPMEDCTLVDEILNHFSQEVEANHDKFLRAVLPLVRLGTVTDRMIGFIVALPATYDAKFGRAQKLIQFAQRYAASKYIGEVGTCAEFVVKVIEIFDFMKAEEKIYGYRVSDQDGNIGIFFSKEPPENNVGFATTAPRPGLGLRLFDCFIMKATPKGFGVNKNSGVKETQFSRVRVVENIGPGSAE